MLLSNRAFAHTRLENHGSAVQDSSLAIEFDPQYAKAYYRRGSSHYALGHFMEALKDFRMVTKLQPKDADGRRKLKECESALRKQRFEEAISAPEAAIVKLSETIDVKAMQVEAAYDGARMEEDSIVTKEFLLDMLSRFKNGKTIHTATTTSMLPVGRWTRGIPRIQDIFPKSA